VEFLILGGGTGGCVLAARLSENPLFRVTLIEAGADLTEASMTPHVRSRYPGRAYLDPTNIWPDLKAQLGMGGMRRARRYEQAKVLGGGSAINAMVANRGAPGDYDEWGALGAEGWSWDAALPYFRKLETDADFDGAYHGKDGPVPIRRISQDRMSPFVKAVSGAAEALGYPRRADQNGEWGDGIYVGAIAKSERGERAPTSVVYLTPEVRRRPNLRVLTGRLAERLVIEGGRAVGAVVSPVNGGAAETLRADEVIVSSGAIHTPALLMRSGIGPGAALQRQGISVAAGLNGVGANLMEHPSTAVSTYLSAPMRLGDLDEHHDHAILRFSSGLEGTPEGDMHIAMIARSGWHAVGQRIGTLFIWVNKAYSRGAVTLAGPDAQTEPDVDFRLLSDMRDLERLKIGFRTGASLLTHASMAPATGPVFPTSYSARVAAIAGPGAVNTLQRGLFAGMLDYAGPLRAALIRNAVTLGVTLDTLLEDDAALTDFIAGSVGGVWHASGTCRMGRADDPLAVTGGSGLVKGVERLRVCDASLMPSIPRANTNTPTIMIAERIADLVKAERR
jgi:5-(hydroxymethyl)furfural/furfural oxidase